MSLVVVRRLWRCQCYCINNNPGSVLYGRGINWQSWGLCNKRRKDFYKGLSLGKPIGSPSSQSKRSRLLIMNICVSYIYIYMYILPWQTLHHFWHNISICIYFPVKVPLYKRKLLCKWPASHHLSRLVYYKIISWLKMWRRLWKRALLLIHCSDISHYVKAKSIVLYTGWNAFGNIDVIINI